MDERLLPDWERLRGADRRLRAWPTRSLTEVADVAHGAMERFVTAWNRDALDLRSDEVLAQILDRGSLRAWCELYRLAAADPLLRRRIHCVIRRVPLPYPAYWLAALESLGEVVDYEAPLPVDPGIA